MNALTLEKFGVERTPAAIRDGPRRVLHNLTFSLAPGSSVGLVGRSGAGKSTLGNALLGLLPSSMQIAKGSTAWIGEENLLTLRGEALRAARGKKVAMVFQEPLLALDPAMKIGSQLSGALRAHQRVTRAEATERAVEMLSRVGIGDARRAARRYPHELSGGMRQRLLLALALLLEPEVLIADEPTTALDATMQAQILDLVDALRVGSRTALLLISHDLAIVGERCERVLVLEKGELVDEGTPAELRARGRAAPAWPVEAAKAPEGHLNPLLVLDDIAVHFKAPRGLRERASGTVRAVDGVSLTVASGECLGLVGESGCGKTTLARAALGLLPLTRGRVRFGGADLTSLTGAPLRRMRRRAQLVPQDAGASLTPHLTVEELLREVIEVHAIEERPDVARRVKTLLTEVGLDASFAPRLSRDLSTGERQRVAIARALACDPELLICDEPVANLDTAMRDEILTLLERLRLRHGLSLLLISHDLPAVRRLASRVAVMYLGRIVERSDSPAALDTPLMPYAAALRSAVPTGDPATRSERIVLRGELPSPLQPPAGCPFHPRCHHPARDASCGVDRQTLNEVTPGRWVACAKVAGGQQA